MTGLPYCKGYRFADIDKAVRHDTGMTYTLSNKREVWLRQAVKKAKEKKKEGDK